jgi:hypothetical protein
MSASDLDAALGIIDGRREEAFFAGPRDETLIAKAEEALGGAFPPAYRRFVQNLGAGSLGSIEIYGVIAEPFDGPVPDVVWITLEERERGSIARDLIIVGDSGDGGYYCVRHGDDGPVFLTWPNGTNETVAPDFGAYLVSRLIPYRASDA